MVHLRITEFPLHSARPSSLVVYIIIIFLVPQNLSFISELMRLKGSCCEQRFINGQLQYNTVIVVEPWTMQCGCNFCIPRHVIMQIISVEFLHHTSLELSLSGSKVRTRYFLLNHLLNGLTNIINSCSIRRLYHIVLGPLFYII